MPLHTSFTAGSNTQVYVWKITESHDELWERTRNLKDVCITRLEGMKSEQHRRGFLSVRMLLQEAGYTDMDMFYAEDGKPHLKDGKNISITHSHNFSAIIISNENVGIDMEMQRDKITKIARKYCETEFSYLEPKNEATYIRSLTVIWGVKEAIFKMVSLPGISFKDHIDVAAFSMDNNSGEATLNFNDSCTNYNFHFKEIEGFTLVYSFEKDTTL
ncbi:4'-phosphopantetheinyl transferase [Flavobacterium suaedae]|uniref:4'-phosphopantetheinyl transferase n=1 Tax=Flavobacterium suaedae TaxID=1767027 RepID=A0ABQ1K5Y6_9FLAO|nr:4'-phosphopantetheinyl transferase superfamily protein [Flavobacterium suaedae]GGB85595.1 4'-phosphopantetheinyl transferase [Flavobacterium suaedae]